MLAAGSLCLGSWKLLPLWTSVLTQPSPWALCVPCPLPTRTAALGQRDHIGLIPSARTRVPESSHSEVLGLRTSTGEFRGHNPAHEACPAMGWRRVPLLLGLPCHLPPPLSMQLLVCIPPACVVPIHSLTFIHSARMCSPIHSFFHSSAHVPLIAYSFILHTHHSPCPACAGPFWVLGLRQLRWQGLAGKAREIWGPAPAG